MALVVKLRAERKAGEFLKEMKEQEQLSRGAADKRGNNMLPRLNDLGIEKIESQRWQRIASIPQEQFEDYILKANRITQSALLLAAKKIENMIKSIDTPDLPSGFFNVIYADPPWQYDFSLTNSREIVQQYPTMDLEDICNLKIPCADDAILFLWATAPKLEESLQVMNAWGFTYRTGMVWVKDKIGMGHLVRIQHEHLLIGKKGNFPAPNDQVLAGSVISAPRQGHSEKPTAVYEIIEKYYPNGKRIELFARHKREGWEAWGNEIE
jgi:N6-adenosine-specific RNA methylase IME4